MKACLQHALGVTNVSGHIGARAVRHGSPRSWQRQIRSVLLLVGGRQPTTLLLPVAPLGPRSGMARASGLQDGDLSRNACPRICLGGSNLLRSAASSLTTRPNTLWGERVSRCSAEIECAPPHRSSPTHCGMRVPISPDSSQRTLPAGCTGSRRNRRRDGQTSSPGAAFGATGAMRRDESNSVVHGTGQRSEDLGGAGGLDPSLW